MSPGRRAAAACATALTALALCAASPEGQSREIGVIRYAMTDAVIEGASAADAKAASLLWARGLATSLGGLYRGAEADVYPTVKEAQAATNAGAADVLAMSSLEYLSVEQTLAARPMLVWELAGAVTSEYVLLARRDNASLGDLKTKSLTIFSPNRIASLSEAWTDVFLFDRNVPAGREALGSLKISTRRGHAAMSVFFRQSDLGVELLSAFRMAAEMNPQLGRELVVIGQSPPLLPGVVCLNTRASQETRRQYIEKASRLHESARYNQAFLVLRVTRLVEFKPNMLDSVRQLAARHRSLQEKR